MNEKTSQTLYTRLIDYLGQDRTWDCSQSGQSSLTITNKWIISMHIVVTAATTTTGLDRHCAPIHGPIFPTRPWCIASLHYQIPGQFGSSTVQSTPTYSFIMNLNHCLGHSITSHGRNHLGWWPFIFPKILAIPTQLLACLFQILAILSGGQSFLLTSLIQIF